MKKIGIIGCGKIAQVRHIPELYANPEAEIVGYYNPTRSRAEEMSARYGGKVFETIDDLLADETIEAVVIDLPRPLQGHQARCREAPSLWHHGLSFGLYASDTSWIRGCQLGTLYLRIDRYRLRFINLHRSGGPCL